MRNAIGRSNDRGVEASSPALLLRIGVLLLAAAVLVIAITGERTALFQDSVWWPRQVASRLGYSSPPTEADPSQEIRCLALNIYFEARGEPMIGKVAVGQVVMNRVWDTSFPDSVCAVVRQGGAESRHRCQFSWWCDGESDRPRDERGWAESRDIARQVYWGEIADPTRGALWYHTTAVAPDWRTDLIQGPTFGEHRFYLRRPAVRSLLQAVVGP